MSFSFVLLKEKGIEGLLLGLSRCYTYVILKVMRSSAMGDLPLGGHRYGECSCW